MSVVLKQQSSPLEALSICVNYSPRRSSATETPYCRAHSRHLSSRVSRESSLPSHRRAVDDSTRNAETPRSRGARTVYPRGMDHAAM